jgi:hypothetical protein
VNSADTVIPFSGESENLSIGAFVRTTSTAGDTAAVNISTGNKTTYNDVNTRVTATPLVYDLFQLVYRASPHYKWFITLTKKCYVNGTLHQAGDEISWSYSTSVAYLILPAE